ncbi:MAG: epoxyqueuosine reductase QueH [Lachnospiraceae bacterium]|nr:epoxyqueuosine reductase QueH [Lachnospiraceae bacterium]
MNKLNTQQQMDALIGELEKSGKVPKLLLHSCCAPCSSYVLEYLSKYFEIIDLYYNPNISPREEYETRTAELKRLVETQPHDHPVRFLEGRYDEKEFYEAVRGLENEPEGGERCRKCFELRLREALKTAVDEHADYFATTLTISPLKNAEVINETGEAVRREFCDSSDIAPEDVPAYLPSDFKKRGGYQRSIELSKEYDLYRQNYCGCVFSKRDAVQREKGENG